MKRHLVLILFFAGLFPVNSVAQKLYFSNIPRLNAKAYYNKVIGENSGGVYMLRFRDVDLKSGFTLERYSHNMDFTESENYVLGKKEKLIKIFTCDSGLCLIKSGREKNKIIFSFIRTGFGIGNFKSGDAFYETDQAENTSDNAIIEYSLNRKYISLWTEETNKKGEQVFHCIVLQNDGKVIENSSYETRYPAGDIEMEQVAVSDSGESAMVYLLTRPDKRITETAAEEHFIIGTNKSKITEPITLGDHKFFLSSYDLVYDQFAGKFLVAGFYDYKKPKTAHGILDFYFSPDENTPDMHFTPLNRQFVATVIGAKEEEAGEDPDNYYIRKIIPRSDGGYLLIAEFFEISQQMETFYLNGIPQVSTKNIYNYNDILLISMDSKREPEWEHQLIKRQSSYASLSYLSSIGVYVCEKNVNIVYNDNSNQNNRVMHVSLSRDGFIEQKILMNSENEYTAIIPMEGKQTGYNRYVAPLIQNRQTILIQMVEVNQ